LTIFSSSTQIDISNFETLGANLEGT